MKILYRMSMKFFLKYFIFSVLFFVLILELLDVFSNLWRYINNGVSFADIIRVAVLYIPKCIVFSLPISVLFSVAYTLGSFYANNELIAVFSSGISLYRFVFPFVLVGALLSPFALWFEENVVISTYNSKNELTYNLLNSQKNYNNNNVTIMDHEHERIYHADFYNDTNKTLSGVIIVDKGEGYPVRMDAQSGKWNSTRNCWEFFKVRFYRWEPGESLYRLTESESFSAYHYNQPPESFRNITRNIGEMKKEEAENWIASLKKAGLPYREYLTEYYKRFSFSLTPFVVALISVAFTGKFRKNVLLMSLLMSMIIAGAYYILQMILVLFAKLGYIHPVMGAWSAFIIFMILSIFMFRYADT